MSEHQTKGTAAQERGAYGPRRGSVKINLAGGGDRPDELTLSFTEHLPENRAQHRFVVKTADEITVQLLSGEYTMQIHARGYETIRGLAMVVPGRQLTVDAVLEPRKPRERPFEERLAKYGIDASATELVDLEVPKETTHALNHEKDDDKRGFAMLESNRIAQDKAWIGSEDDRFGHDRPVFGPLPDRKLLAALLRDETDLRTLQPEEIEAVTALAREYVHGNSTAVAQYEGLLDTAIKVAAENGVSRFPLYFYRVVTIGAGATLEVGNGSAIFACDELRIHTTGTLKPVANVTIDIGTYTEFA